jgi:hypothetical protein
MQKKTFRKKGKLLEKWVLKRKHDKKIKLITKD